MAKSYEYQSIKNIIKIDASTKHFDLYLDPAIELDDATLNWFRAHGVWKSKDHWYINFKIYQNKKDKTPEEKASAYRKVANILRYHFTKDWMYQSKEEEASESEQFVRLVHNIFA